MTVSQAIDNLGGSDVFGTEIRSEVEFVERVEQGIPVRAADALRELGGLSEAELGEIVPRRTLSHARTREKFSPEQSDRIVRAARVYTYAHDVFANREKANRWMRRSNRELEGKTPLSLLRTSSGTDLVNTLLDRIAYGIYS